VVAQTRCPSRNPKGSSHKGLNRGIVQATDTLLSKSGVMVSTAAGILYFKSVMLRVVVAQTLCPSRNPKVSSHKGPARSPDLTPCDYFLWGYVKDKVFVPPQPGTYRIWRTELPRLWRRSHLTSWAEYGRNWTIASMCAVWHRTFVGMCRKLVELLFHFY